MQILSDYLGRFRVISIAEGISFIILLGIAMPLKYIWDMPQAVKVIGMLHGILFITYSILLIVCWASYKWKFSTAFLLFIASFFPFGNFIAEYKFLKKQSKKDTA